MSADILPVLLNNADLEILLARPDMLSGAGSWQDVLQFCRQFRMKGIASLLLTGSASPFRLELSKSAHAFLHSLAHLRDVEQATGRGLPFFDAVAALDLDCARAIARASRQDWNPDRELEDEFLYVFLLMKRYILNAPEPECTAIHNRWFALLNGEEDVKLELCDCLENGDAEGFDHALSRWLDEQQDEYAQLIDSDALHPDVAVTEARISVEGLALVRLAEARGLKLDANYPLIPALARTTSPLRFDPDAWKR
jgi:hypothetical protein